MPHLRRWKTALFVLTAVGLVGAAALFGASWYYTESLKNDALEPDHEPPEPDLEVIAVEGGRVTLRATSAAGKDGDWTKPGIFGLEWDGGYNQVGAILAMRSHEVVRELLQSEDLPRAGEHVRLDSFAFLGDPQRAYGIPFKEVMFTSPIGEFPAWFVDGGGDRWAIFVHGKGARREEALRMLPTVSDLGLSALVITYRNDIGVPAGPDGFYRYGKTEWQDLEGAADYALEHGAKELVVIGYSMGGGIVMSFLLQSPLAERVVGVILDSPMLDFGAAVDHGARRRSVPALLRATGRRLAGYRFDIDWGELNYLSRADKLRVPILLFHGDDDDRVPVETSDALAEARPDIVTYVRTSGAGHVRSWNIDPDAYAAAMREFLVSLER
jgi:pimeloyl-ACP methyl ester carboxylesterase